MKMKITIEGPQGVGKTRVGERIRQCLDRELNYSFFYSYEGETVQKEVDALIIEKTTNFEEENSSKIYNKNDPWEAVSDCFKQLKKSQQSIEEIKYTLANEIKHTLGAHSAHLDKLEAQFKDADGKTSPAENLNDNFDKPLKDYLLTEAKKLDTDLRLAALKHIQVGLSDPALEQAEAVYQWLSKGTLNDKKIKKG